MKSKRKVIAFVFILVMLSVNSSMLLFAKNTNLAFDIFNVDGVLMDCGQVSSRGNSGIKMSAKASGGSANLINNINGDFSTQFEYITANSIANFTVKFESVINAQNKFSVHIEKRGNAYQAYVVVNGQKNGEYVMYSGSANSGLTNNKNTNGIYTAVGERPVFKVSYFAESGDVKVGNNRVWNIKKSEIDGKKSFTVDDLLVYNVTYEFTSISDKAEVLLIEAGGHKLDRIDLVDKSAPFISAKIGANAIINKPYVVKEPMVSDLVQGEIKSSSVVVSIKNSANQVLLNKNYEDSLNYVFESSGDYVLSYSVSDSKGNSATKNYNIKAVEQEETDYKFSSNNLSVAEVGAMTKVSLPTAKIISNLVSEQFAYLIVECDGKVVKNFNRVKADVEREFVFEKAGVYKFTYCHKDNDSILKQVKTVTAKASIVTFSDFEIEDRAMNSILTVPKAKAYLNGVAYDTVSIITFPYSGKYSNSNIKLTEMGEYKVTYCATINQDNYYFDEIFKVKYGATELFTNDAASVKYGVSDYNCNLNGLEVVSTAAGRVEYNKIIDLSKMTKDDLLIDLIATPICSGIGDFTTIYVNLTDIHDKNNEVSIRIKDAESNSYMKSYIQAKATGQIYTGLEGGQPNPATQWGGTVIQHSFCGDEYAWNYPVYLNSVKLYFDYGSRSLYVNESALSSNLSQVIDFDDPNHFNSAWNGFTTGEVKLSISVGGVKGRAKYMVNSIAGVEFKDFLAKDVVAPILNIDAPQIIPLAEVGTKYPIFKAVAKDMFDENLYTQTKVFYDYNNKMEIGIFDGAFTPIVQGTYYIEYSAMDSEGNKTIKVVEVEAKSKLDKFEIVLDETTISSAEIGKKVAIKGYCANGGSGKNTITINIKNLADNKEYDLSDNYFMPISAGTHQVSYVGVDYLGYKTTVIDEITVLENFKPVINEDVSFPFAFISGEKYELPTMTAIDYASANQAVITGSPIATINGKSVQIVNGNITPIASQESESVLLRYSFVGKSGTAVYEKEIPIIITKDGKKIKMEKYFATNGFTVSSTATTVNVKTTQNNSDFKFIKPLSAENFNFIFNIDPTRNNAEAVIITLTDKINAKNKIEMKITNKSKFSINGGAEVDINGAFDGTSTYDFKISYNNNNFYILDSRSVRLAIAQTNLDGSVFDGFTSGEVYLDFRVENVTGEFCAQIKEINDQVFSRLSKDVIAPIIQINDLLGGQSKIGDEIIVYPAYAYDVLSYVQELKVSVSIDGSSEKVKTLDGVELTNLDASKEYKFKIQSVGAYRVSYFAKDSAGQEKEVSKLITVRDNQAPTITINGKVPTVASVNKEIKLPSFTATDNLNSDVTLNIIAVTPSGQQIIINDCKYTPTIKGNLLIKYCAFDLDYNFACQEYVIYIY